MRKFSFTSIDFSTASFNIAMLFLRVCFGLILMLKHGFDKVRTFDTLQHTFYSFMGLGAKTSLVLALFAEIFCSLLVVLGLFTRLACIPLLITFLVIIFGHDAGKDFFDSELAVAYFAVFLVILMCGPGKISVDGMINKEVKKNRF